MADKKKEKKDIPKDEEEKQVLNEEEEPKESEEVEEIVEDINEESEVEKLTKQLDKLKNDYARAYADTENLKNDSGSGNDPQIPYPEFRQGSSSGDR